MPLALIAAGELASAVAAGERLLAGVCANVCGQVVAAAEAAHADAALERLLACVHAHMARQLIRPGEAAVAAVSRAGVRTFVQRCLALPACWGLPGPVGFSEVSLVGGARGGALRLCLDLRGEGFDGGERCEWRLRQWRVQAL